jgi:hypothetical protein
MEKPRSRARRMKLVAVEGSEDEVLGRAAAVERGSSHPIGLAVIAAATARGIAIPQAFGGATAIPGKAVTARLRDGFVSVGEVFLLAAFRCWLAGYETGDVACWELAWQGVSRSVRLGDAKRAASDILRASSCDRHQNYIRSKLASLDERPSHLKSL